MVDADDVNGDQGRRAGSRPTSTGRSPASASTRPSRTPGTHVGKLWTASGTLLASGTFGGETGSGWQMLTLRDAGRRSRRERRTWRPITHQGATTRLSLDDFYRRARWAGTRWTPRRCTPHRRQRRHPQRHVHVQGRLDVPRLQRYSGENYAVDVIFIPKLPPGPVGLVTATAGPGQATVSFLAPASGGSPSRYTVMPYVGTIAQTRGRRRREPTADVDPRRQSRSGNVIHVQGAGRATAAVRARSRRPPTQSARTRRPCPARRRARRRAWPTRRPRSGGPPRATADARSPATRSRPTSAGWPSRRRRSPAPRRRRPRWSRT